MKYLSLFSGIGGFELGIQQAYEEIKLVETTTNTLPRGDIEKSKSRGWFRKYTPDCIGYSEIDKYACQIYNKHFNHKNYGDITTLNIQELPDFDLLVGGFPCQSFSIAGKRRGFDDTRGTLFFNIAEIIREKQPRLLLLENVKGLLSHDKGRTFYTIISTLDELGYDCQWQVLNSKNFGVPQNRERVFIIGHLRGTSRPQVFPIGETTTGSLKVSARGKHQQDIVYRSDGIMCSLPAGTHASTPHLTKTEIIQINQPKHSNDRVYSEKGISPTLNTMQGGNRQPFISKETKIRRLTPTECERLQGFPDGWTEGLSDTQRYKTLGNAVTVNVIKEIISKLYFNAKIS